MTFSPPERFNIAQYFLDDQVEGDFADKAAVIQGERSWTYREIQALSHQFGNMLRELGVTQEQRVMIALPDIPEFPAALFGILKIGGVMVMVNSQLKPDDILYFYNYTRAKVVIVHADHLPAFEQAAAEAPHLEHILVVGESDSEHPSFDDNLGRLSTELDEARTHRDDPAIWLFSGGTTGKPKAVVQSHTAFVNTTELYAKGVLGFCSDDITLSVPKLYFGYATGTNLLFPFSVGATVALFPERCTADALFEQIRLHRPTILINVPTMINHMVSHPEAGAQDLSCLRLATSAGEALPVALHERWTETFGEIDLLDGLGTAEMWHIFVSNGPGDVKPGTLGRVVPGFEIRLCDDDGQPVPDGEIGKMRVRGDSRAQQYWQQGARSLEAFHGEWYHSGDMMSRDADGYYTYCGRGDDMLKIGGKWLTPKEVENCLLQHETVTECAVVGVTDKSGLTKPVAYVIAPGPTEGLDEVLQQWVRDALEPYKYPRQVIFVDDLPRTHLGKVDRGKLRRDAEAG